MSRRVGLVGARGHVGVELIRLISAHPELTLDFVASRELAGQHLAEQLPDTTVDVVYEQMDACSVAGRKADVLILALPNDASGEYVEAIEAASPDSLLVDLSADHRFDPAWYYGLPELTRARWRGERRISNPGCYATAMQLSLAPLKAVLAAPPVCFGVSGYSGAGSKQSDRNDPDKLRDNLMPYALTGHMHEKEASWQLGVPVEFMPHVAPHFRGLSVTSNIYLSRPMQRDELQACFRQAYRDEPLIRVTDEIPWISRIAYCQHAEIGAFSMSPDGRRAVIVVTLDNLLKGAATQAMQNINRAIGVDEWMAIPSPEHSLCATQTSS